MGVRVLPEERDSVEAYDRQLRLNESAVIDHVAQMHEVFAGESLTPLDGIGWPLRPFFFPRARLDFICRAIHERMMAFRAQVLERCGNITQLAEDLPLHPEVLAALNLPAAFADPDFGLVHRPDGFWFDDHFVLTEPNFGNGYLISCAYPEMVYRFLESSPATLGLHQAPAAADVVRPLDAIIEMIMAKASTPNAHVAILAHHEEHEIILSWEERVIQLVYAVQRELQARGLSSRLVHEDQIVVDEAGVARDDEGRQIDVVFHLPIGTHFMYRPDLLHGPLAHFCQPRIGQAPFLQPLGHLVADKGAMPLLQRQPEWPVTDADGFRVECAYTEYPDAAQAAGYRAMKDRLVLKRSFEGKDTHVGVATHARTFNRVLDEAMATRDYVVQEYTPMPIAQMPAVVDGRIEWLQVRVELSLLVIGGQYAGGFARYAPDAEGLVLSPPPEGMGFTVLWTS